MLASTPFFAIILPQEVRRKAVGLLAAATLLLLVSCSGRVPNPFARLSRSPAATADSARSAPIPLDPASEEDPLAADPAEEEPLAETDQPLARADFEDPLAADAAALPPDPDEWLPALDPVDVDFTANEGENALLDELIGLTLPDPPRVLTEEEALLHTRSELPLVMNEHVERLINYFAKTKRGTATIRASFGRGNAYRPMIERILREEDVPKELFYLAMAESGFRPKAHSRVRATGMWQFMSSRGKQYGLRQDRYVDLRYDAATATRAAAKHLKDLQIEFGDWYLAMAAYNSGPNRVRSAIRRTGSRDYWTLVRRRALPRETRNYVPIILAMTYVCENLDLFDVGEIDLAPPLRNDRVRTQAETSFALIADATDVSVETVKELNPALLRSATPPYGYDLTLPAGTAAKYAREIASVPPDRRLNWRRYEVREGETLQAVANRFKVAPAELASLNSLASEGILAGGQRLTVPTKTRLSIYRYYGTAGGFLEPGTGRYRIARGDTLGGIAQRFGVTVSTLKAWNGLSSTRIIAGRYLIVNPTNEGGGAAAVASSSGAPSGRYTVRRGDTLSTIGVRVGASVAQLRAWNGIRGSTIRIGQTLRVPGQTATRSGTASARVAPPASGQYRVRSGDSLSTIAARFGVTVGELRSWNGIRGDRIGAGQLLAVRRPAGSASRPSGASAGAGRYSVRRGDTLGTIAERHGVTAAQLRAWNGIRGSRIYPGQELIVGNRGSSSASSATPRQPAAPNPSASADRYTVRRGDTLGAIAERYGVTAANLRAWNGIRGSRIHPGQELVLRAGTRAAGTARSASQPAAPNPSASADRYTVRRGDTLGGIAERYGVTAANLRAWNGIRGSRIHPGQELVVGNRGSSTASSATARQPTAPSPGADRYTVRRGDTLGGIAERYGVTAANLRAWNGIRGSRIHPGQELVVRNGSPAGQSQSYRIRSGDTLETIAKRFDVTVQDLKRWNGLRSSRIHAGRTLAIRPSGS